MNKTAKCFFCSHKLYCHLQSWHLEYMKWAVSVMIDVRDLSVRRCISLNSFLGKKAQKTVPSIKILRNEIIRLHSRVFQLMIKKVFWMSPWPWLWWFICMPYNLARCHLTMRYLYSRLCSPCFWLYIWFCHASTLNAPNGCFSRSKSMLKILPLQKAFRWICHAILRTYDEVCVKFSLEKSMYFHPVYTQWANFHVVRSRFHSLATSDMTDSIRIRIGVESIWRVAHTKQHMCVFIGSCAWIFVSG